MKKPVHLNILYNSYTEEIIFQDDKGFVFAEVPVVEYKSPDFDIRKYLKQGSVCLPNSDSCNFSIKRITYDPPATVVFWTDNTKTISKCTDNDKFSKEYGVAMCFMKKIFGSRAEFLRQVEKGGIKKYQNKKNKINNKCRMCEYHDHPVSEADLPCYDCKDDKLSRWTPINWEDRN